MELIIGVSSFIAVLFIFICIYLLISKKSNKNSQRLHKQLQSVSLIVGEVDSIDITKKKRKLSNIPWLNKLLLGIPFLQKMDRVLQQSNLKYPLGVFLLFTFTSASLVFLISFYLLKNSMVSMVVAVATGTMPILYIIMKKNLRMRRFDQQLPNALDMAARAMRAGHAFSVGLKMVTEEFDDPIQSEFSKVVEEINFGTGVKEALINLTERVDSQDVKFFAVAVTIQRETGGDLAEILENISRLIRERFKLHDRIRTLTAEGKLSAMILLGLPFCIAGVLSFVNPKHIGILLNCSMGNILIGISVSAMIAGVLVMKKIVAIKV